MKRLGGCGTTAKNFEPSAKSSLKFLSFNARSLCNKLSSLQFCSLNGS